MTDRTGKMPLHRAKIIARNAANALAGEDGSDVVPALAILVIDTLQERFHEIDDARAILQQIHDFENEFLNEAYPGGTRPEPIHAEQQGSEQPWAATDEEISEHFREAQQLASRIAAEALRGAALPVQMFAVAFLATHLGVGVSDTIEKAHLAVEAIFVTAKESIPSMFEAKQYGVTRQ